MWWNDYVGIPFKWCGEDRDGLSCWGLVKLVQAEVFGRDIPRLEELEHHTIRGRNVPNPYISLGFKVDVIQPGDIVHMWSRYEDKIQPLHCGIVTTPGNLLHVELDIDTVVVSYRQKLIKDRILGFYRFA